MTQVEANIIMPNSPFFLLTVDTEEEWDWSGSLPSSPFSTQNIDQIPEFQEVCKENGIKPTYFVDYAVADNKDNVATIKHYFDRDECDYGAHLHPWANPPLSEPISDRNSHAINLPISLFQEKILFLTERLKNEFGSHPYSYRAGRWGVNARHLKILWDIGYQIDSSVRPFYREKYFAYDVAPTSPYFPSLTNVLLTDDERIGILEIPSTSGYNNSRFEMCDSIHTKLSAKWLKHLRLIGILWKLGLLKKITVTPEGTSFLDIRACIDASMRRGDHVINMFFHSSNLLPGETPYVRNAKEKEVMMDCVIRSADYVREEYGGRIVCMRELKKLLTGLS